MAHSAAVGLLGIAISACVGPVGACTTTNGWQHAPDIMRHIFAYGNAVLPSQIGGHVGWAYLLAAAALILFWPFLNVNANSLHQLYRDRLGSAFLTCRSKHSPGNRSR